MRIKNKKTGEIVEWEHGLQYKLGKEYQSVEEFVKDWEDYNETERWFINADGVVYKAEYKNADTDFLRDTIGNYFETKEEAEKAVEKLRAWKRLRDAGFKFTGWDFVANDVYFKFPMPVEIWLQKYAEELDLLFGGPDEKH